MKSPILLVFLSASSFSLAFQVGKLSRNRFSVSSAQSCSILSTTCLRNTEGSFETPGDDQITFESEAKKKEAVGNLVADDEWMGLSMELSEIVRVAVIEDIKSKARDFLGKEDYKVGDISKEIDSRVKGEVAKMRGKEEYEIGDFVLAMDEMSKSLTEELTGKPYEPGDLSIELDKRVKSAVANFVGKDEYEFGDLTREIANRVQNRVEEFTGKPYEFGDVSRAIEEKRRKWIEGFLGKDAAENYRFGDITKKALASFTGKDEYEFGDVTKKLLGDIFGKRKRGGTSDS